MTPELHGLYALTPDDRPDLLDAVSSAISGGARLIQYRDKNAPDALRHERAQALLSLCRKHGIPLIINDDVALAETLGADGVHLGAEDLLISEARRRLPDALIGASCYNDFERAKRAEASGASYVAFGSFYPSPTQPEAVTASLDLLNRGSRELSLPVCAIGGIHAEQAASLIDAGAHLLAVCSALFTASDIQAAASSFTRQFQDHE